MKAIFGSPDIQLRISEISVDLDYEYYRLNHSIITTLPIFVTKIAL